MKKALQLVAWDDPRCTAPIAAAQRAWACKSGIEIEVSVRSLEAFNDQPLRELAPHCDLMVVDYPHVARAISESAIVSFDELLGAEAVRPIADRAIGNAQVSFVVDGAHAALACDAACHLSASRPVKFTELGCGAPSTWQDIFTLADSNPGTVAVALSPTDAISILLSLAHGAGTEPDGGSRLFRNARAARLCAATLARLASTVPEYCWHSSPQDIFRIAEEFDEISYIPLTFGYSRKVRREEGGWRFLPPPEGCGSLLGGAGMAISSLTKHGQEAAEFALWFCGREGQVLAAQNLGQPSNLAAWDNPGTDSEMACFFQDARAIQETAFVRPLASWWPSAQVELGTTLVEEIRGNSDLERIIEALESVYRRHREESET
ncbi:MAG: hypothetical protein OXI01_22990 [Albidovulum sp.]|nr:hypothetical protein [Albidovulum sp.]